VRHKTRSWKIDAAKRRRSPWSKGGHVRKMKILLVGDMPSRTDRESRGTNLNLILCRLGQIFFHQQACGPYQSSWCATVLPLDLFEDSELNGWTFQFSFFFFFFSF
jgi:hypothetical protein